MSVQQVESLVGPSRAGMWRYEWADGSMTIDFSEEVGARSFHRVSRDEVGQTNEGWTSNGAPVQTRFARAPNGFLKKEWEHSVSPSSLPILYRDPQAKVLQLYGQAPYMELHFAEPLFGHFRNGKLIAWFMTPQIPIVQWEGNRDRATG
jgi:hypothetical protein